MSNICSAYFGVILLFNIELKKLGVKIFREISYFSSPKILKQLFTSDVSFEIKERNKLQLKVIQKLANGR